MPRSRALARLLLPLVLVTACASSATRTPPPLGVGTANSRTGQAPSVTADSPATVSPAPAGPPATRSSDLDTVSTYFDAINRKDWPDVWALGGRNLNPSYDQMIAGYARTAHDDPTIYAHHGNDVSVALLARAIDGTTQLFTGDYSVQAGMITRASLRLRGTDRGHLAGAYAGFWGGHGRTVTITTGGLGVVSYRTYRDCAPDVNAPCDPTEDNYIIDGGLELFQITMTDGVHGTAQTIAQQGRAGLERLTLSDHGHVLDLDNYPDGSFCDDHASADTCGV